MGQSNAIFGFLFIAFLVYITMKGELPVYLGFLFGGPQVGGSQRGGGVTINNVGAAAANAAASAPADLSNVNTFVGPTQGGG
jgi:hypothetical protein